MRAGHLYQESGKNKRTSITNYKITVGFKIQMYLVEDDPKQIDAKGHPVITEYRQ